MDHLGTLNDTTPRIKVSTDHPAPLDVVFGLDTSLFSKGKEEAVDWKALGGEGKWHGDEVEVKTVWRGGQRPGTGKRKREHDHDHKHQHADGENCDCEASESNCVNLAPAGDVTPLSKGTLEEALGKLSFEIYRGEFLTPVAPSGPSRPSPPTLLSPCPPGPPLILFDLPLPLRPTPKRPPSLPDTPDTPDTPTHLIPCGWMNAKSRSQGHSPAVKLERRKVMVDIRAQLRIWPARAHCLCLAG